MAKRTKATPDVNAEEFMELGGRIMGVEYGVGSVKTFERRWTTCFGVHPVVVAESWRRIQEGIDEENDAEMKGSQPVHLLWALMFLKKATKEADLAKDAGCDEKTFRKWYKIHVRRIAYLQNEVVSTALIWLRQPADRSVESLTLRLLLY
jgi:hypothetical protein